MFLALLATFFVVMQGMASYVEVYQDRNVNIILIIGFFRKEECKNFSLFKLYQGAKPSIKFV